MFVGWFLIYVCFCTTTSCAYDRHGDSDEVLLLLADAVVDAEGTNNSGIQVVFKIQTEGTLAR